MIRPYLHFYGDAQRSLFPDLVPDAYRLDRVEGSIRTPLIDPSRRAQYLEVYDSMLALHHETGLAVLVSYPDGSSVRALMEKKGFRRAT